MTTSDGQPTVGAGVDPLDDLVLTVRGDENSAAPDYELPPSVTLDKASEILGLDREGGRRRVKSGSYPVPVIDLGPAGYRVGTAPLIRTAGLDKVREALRVQG
ncbi:hypothetical protein [Streptomyces sp. NPDC006134]|uniref:hypothetical protein n=1 Tax=Streptomyces sp. NPDC006134 TaxID=3154467 RepID=UPI00340BE44F